MAILYTQAQVNDALLRAQVAMYVISENIEDGFTYFVLPIYASQKALQYDIYTLFDVVDTEKVFVTYNPVPTSYEMMFYDLVGAMINKIKQVDVYGEFGGTVNPNYQNPGTTIIVTGGSVIPPIEFTIPAGTAIPFAYPYASATVPDVSFYISNGAGGKTTNGATGITNNLIGGVMYIYGNDNGMGLFNEDTYTRITP